MADLIILQPDPRARAALLEALDRDYSLELADGWPRLLETLNGDPPLGCVLDVFSASPPLHLTRIRSLRSHYPAVALIIHSDFSGREMELYHLGRLSVDGVLRLEEEPTTLQIQRVVASALAVCLADMVVKTVAGDLPLLARESIQWGIERADSRPQVSDLAAAMGLSPRAYLREMKAMDMTTPRRLLLWCRLIHAAHLLERPGITVEGAAFRLGYSTGGALRKALKRHMECTPTSLRQRGGLALALEMFQRKALRRGHGRRDRWPSTGSPRWRISDHRPRSR